MTDEPRLSAQQMIEQLESVLSPKKRFRAVVALLAGLAGLAFVGTLWLTEPGPLPGHTNLAFGLFTVLCLAWACYGGWLLTRRVPLFAGEQVVAAWLALTASVATTALVATVAVQRDANTMQVLVIGACAVVLALGLVVSAHTRRAALLRRKRELVNGG